MLETIGNPHFFKTPENPAEQTADFCNNHFEEIVDLMHEAEIGSIAEINEIQPNIPPHANKVYIAEIPTRELFGDKKISSSNGLRYYALQRDGQTVMRTVFKPLDGEDAFKKKHEFIDPTDSDGYIREAAGSIVDRRAKLGVTPPIIIKAVNGSVGSLRPYIPQEIADAGGEPNFSMDWKKMACLDRLINNCDRKSDNYLTYKDVNRVASIDLGYAFFKQKPTDANLAYNFFASSPEKGILDEEMRIGLQALVDAEEELTSPLDELDQLKNYPDKRQAILASDEKRIARLLVVYDVFDTARAMLANNTIIV